MLNAVGLDGAVGEPVVHLLDEEEQAHVAVVDRQLGIVLAFVEEAIGLAKENGAALMIAHAYKPPSVVEAQSVANCYTAIEMGLEVEDGRDRLPLNLRGSQMRVGNGHGAGLVNAAEHSPALRTS